MMPSTTMNTIVGPNRIGGTAGCTRDSLSSRSDSNIRGEAFSASLRLSPSISSTGPGAIAGAWQPQQPGDPVARGLGHDSLVSMLHEREDTCPGNPGAILAGDACRPLVRDPPGAEPQAGHLPLPAVWASSARTQRAHADRAGGRFP